MTADRDARIARLDDHLRGLGADPDGYEDDLFARAAEGVADELAFLDRMAVGLRDLVARGTVDPWITAAETDALRARYGDALVVRELGVDRTETVDGTETVEVPRHAEVVVTRLALDLRGVDRIDVEVLTLDGTPVKTMVDVRFDPADGAVFACCEGELARRTVGPPVRSRVWTVRGRERHVARELVTRIVLGA